MTCTARALLAASVHPESDAPCCCARGGKLRRLSLGPGSTKKTCMPSPRPQLMLSAANRLFTTPASASLLLRLPAYLMGLLSCSADVALLSVACLVQRGCGPAAQLPLCSSRPAVLHFHPTSSGTGGSAVETLQFNQQGGIRSCCSCWHLYQVQHVWTAVMACL